MDQEAAELYYLRYGTWPSWYTTGLTGSVYGAVRSFPIASTSLLAGSRLIAPTTLLTGSRLVSLDDLAVEKKEVEVKDVDKVEVKLISAKSMLPLGLTTLNASPLSLSTLNASPLGLSSLNAWNTRAILL